MTDEIARLKEAVVEKATAFVGGDRGNVSNFLDATVLTSLKDAVVALRAAEARAAKPRLRDPEAIARSYFALDTEYEGRIVIESVTDLLTSDRRRTAEALGRLRRYNPAGHLTHSGQSTGYMVEVIGTGDYIRLSDARALLLGE